MLKRRKDKRRYLQSSMLNDSSSTLDQGEEDYEAMVARRVAEYVAQGRQHLLSSALTQVLLVKSIF